MASGKKQAKCKADGMLEDINIDMRGFFGDSSTCKICIANNLSGKNTVLPGNHYEFRKREVCRDHFQIAVDTTSVTVHIVAYDENGEEHKLQPIPKNTSRNSN